jgi:DNA-directed RNA polymerase alpha subunit
MFVAGLMAVVAFLFALRWRDSGSDRMLDPTPELADDTPISDVVLPTRIRNVLVTAGLKTVGEVREISDDILLSFNDCGKNSVAYLRGTLGLPSTDGVRLR